MDQETFFYGALIIILLIGIFIYHFGKTEEPRSKRTTTHNKVG